MMESGFSPFGGLNVHLHLNPLNRSVCLVKVHFLVIPKKKDSPTHFEWLPIGQHKTKINKVKKNQPSHPAAPRGMLLGDQRA